MLGTFTRRRGYSLKEYRMDQELNARLEIYEDALRRIEQWSEAYPLDVFPEPDLDKARQLLEAGGITLDSISASCMRHVLTGVGEIVKKALGSRSGR